jgi:polysaccharide biosynthesis transport protein
MTAENAPSGFGDYVALIRRRWLLVATVVPGMIFVALITAFILPVLYRSSATLILEQSSIQEKLIPTTVSSYADQQIEIVQGRVMVMETLEELLKTFDPYPNEQWTPAQKAEEILRNTEIERVDAVTLEPLKKSNAFSLHYSNPDPRLASAGADLLSGLFLTYHQKVRQDAANAATAFLQRQAETVSGDLQKIDQEFEKLQGLHGGALPASQDGNRIARDRAEREVDTLERELRSAQERESLLAIKLTSLSPRIATGPGGLTDLATVRAQLVEAQQKYTSEHPEVKRLQRAVEALAAQGAKDGTGSTIKADNPEYLNVSSQLEAARRDVAALRASVERARTQLMQYLGFIRAAPGIERQYSELQRRRESLQGQFQEIQTKLAEANLGKLFEKEQRGERFAMVRAPYVASSPYSPNRVGIIAIGIMLGFAICAIAMAIVESADPSVRGLKDISGVKHWALLGSVPPIMIGADRRRRVVLVGSLCVAYAIGIVLVVGVMAQAKADSSREPDRPAPAHLEPEL